MKTTLFFRITFIITMFVGPLAFAQVTNGNTYNMQMNFVQGSWDGANLHDGVSQAEASFISRAVNGVAGQPISQFSAAFGAANTPKYSYGFDTWETVWGPTVAGKMGSVIGGTGTMYYEVFAWEDDGGDRYVYDSGDDYAGWEFRAVQLTNSLPGVWNSEGVRGINQSGTTTWIGNYIVQHVWRYTNGTKASPLNFGTLSTGTLTHTNANRAAPANADAALGYTNEWTSSTNSLFKLGQDVSYKFNITGTTKRVIFSTAFTETNFDTYLHVVKLNSDGSFNSYIGGDDDSGGSSKSYKQLDLCSGSYAVIVEGFYSTTEGNFKLSLQTSDLLINPGSVVHTGTNESVIGFCPAATLTGFSNSVSASTQATNNTITYAWERRNYTNADGYSAYTVYTDAGTGASATNLGSMGTFDAVGFRRVAQDFCGVRAETPAVGFVKLSPTANGGTIGINGSATSLVIPTPHEQASGTLTSIANGSGTPGFTISWEKNDGGGWVDAGGGTGQTFTIPTLTVPTQYRRKTTSTCTSTTATSNVVSMNVVFPNGQLTGRVVSKTGAGVNNVTITAVRTSNPAPSGGILNTTYTTTTGVDGIYTFAPVGLYYGNTANGSGAAANFRITPSKGIGPAAHVFEQAFLDKTISQVAPAAENVNFVDKTTFSITGKVTQECATCVNGTPTIPIVCAIKDVEFLIDNTYSGNKTIADGTYGLSVDEQRNYTIKPRYKNHKFAPANIVLAVGETPSIENVNFKDTTTFTISGKVLAGCEEFIGRATLRFTQVLPPINGNPVSGCLIKEITTNAVTGYYSIRLPAGKYRASVESFTLGGTGTNLNNLTVIDFLNNQVLNQDSLIRDIDTTNRVLNLVYPRAPVLEVIGLATVCTPNTNLCSGQGSTPAFSVVAQNDSVAYTIKVWQGPAKTCPAKDSIVYLSTNIQKDDTSEDISFPNPTGIIMTKIFGGTPNIVCPYFKTFNLRYTDIFKRPATAINKNVVVTGLKADIGTFTTVSPEVPIKVLHDPPGDLSYSFWETNTTTENAFRFFKAKGGSENLWLTLKVGAKTSTGIGVEIENEAWGTIGGGVTVSGRNVTTAETIVSVSTTEQFSTANNSEVTGAQGDVFIGSAINLLYSKVNVISYTPPCNLAKTIDLIIAPDGFATDYVYSESHIVNSILPTLRAFRDNPSNTAAQKAKFANQISVWEQVISNNERNKKTAAFEKNRSFDGAVGPITSTTTATATLSNTVEFGMEINTEIALELGFEIAGSGAAGGSITNLKMESGESTTTTLSGSTTTGYVLDDKDSGDFFSIDIKKDPVYSTPVFELVAGTSSCPNEKGTQPRDDMQLVCATPTQTVNDPAGEAEFVLQLSNISQSGEARTYSLSFDQSSNPNGAIVTIGGSPVVGITNYTIAYGGSVNVIVKVKRGASTIFSYPGLKFKLSDNCGGDISKSVDLNAFFGNPCSSITLFSPVNDFRINTTIVPIIMKNYVVANLTNVSLEYSNVGSSSWFTGFTRTAAQLSPDAAAGTQVDWNISTLTDGKYNFRLKLLCGTNVVYTPVVTGVIDRVAPILFGSPEPADDNYVIGDQISATYNEVLGCANMNNTNLILRNAKTNAVVSAQFGCFENKIMIMPLSTMGVAGDSMKVTLLNIRDLAGNVKSSSDTWKFILGTFVPATGNKAVSLSPSNISAPTETNKNPTLNSPNTSISMLENASGTLDFYFNLPANVPNNYVINYAISGSARYGVDYSTSFSPSNLTTGRKILTNQFNGTDGTITILQGQKTAKLSIDPIGDGIFESDETIIITVNEGGDYGISASYTMTATILNDDADDCLNGGNVFVLNNNNIGNTAISAGTYHKSLLETTGTVETPSNVTMKAAKSVTMKPGFQVKAGSIFTANIEGCPPSPAAFSVPIIESNKQNSNNILLASNDGGFVASVTEPSSDIKFEPNVFATVNDKKVFFEFKLDKDEDVTLILLNDFAGEKLRIIDKVIYKAGIYNVEIETSTLKKGDYYLQLTTRDKKTYQKITVI